MKRKKLVNGKQFLEIRYHGIKFQSKDYQPDLLSTKLSFGAIIEDIIPTMDIMNIINKSQWMKMMLWMNQSTNRSLRLTHTRNGLISSHSLISKLLSNRPNTSKGTRSSVRASVIFSGTVFANSSSFFASINLSRTNRSLRRSIWVQR